MVAGDALNDGSAAVVWSHAGYLGRAEDEASVTATSLAAFLAAATLRSGAGPSA